MTTIHGPIARRMAEIHEQFLNGLLDETAYADEIRQVNATAKPQAWERYQNALAYTEYMKSRGFYGSDDAYEHSRMIAWQQYLASPLEVAVL